MKIIGPDVLVFGVEDVAAASQFSKDYGLICRIDTPERALFEALDGTQLDIRPIADSTIPAPMHEGSALRDTIYGVADQQTLDEIAAELGKDREVVIEGGMVRSHDDDGYPIGFQITQRHEIDMPQYRVNCPDTTPVRPCNVVAAIDDDNPVPYTLSHFVLFTRDVKRAEKFYAERLQFRTVDEFTNLGPFMRPAGTNEHHTLFLIQADRIGMQHFTFHFAGANEMLKAGWNMMGKGYESNWGPGRHLLGSNWFWYFESPFGCLFELDADMDLHDDDWVPRRIVADEITSQSMVFSYKAKHSPAAEKRKAAEKAAAEKAAMIGKTENA